MEEQDIIGMSYVVVKGGKVIEANSLGLKNIESNTPLSNDDIFRIASISKSFSATSIMQLVEAKKISLDDDFGKLALGTSRDDIIPGEKMTGHTGSAYGLYSIMFFNPKEDFGFVVIVNGSSTAEKYTRGLRTIMYTTINSLYNNLIK